MHDRVLLAESWPAGEVFRLPGGYVDDGGVVHREVELVPLTGADEERLAGLNAPAVAVITQLLARVVRRIGTLPQPGPGVMRSLLVGDRDFLVVKLRQLTLGDEVDIDLSCANAECGKRMDLSFVLTNMPLGRFRQQLEKDGKLDAYRKSLREAFNPATLPHLMCRHQISVDWDGTVYDCDFNLALAMPVNHGAPDRIDRFDHAQLVHRRIMTGNHCFGCTAGAGSSCAGVLAV